jgi:hypothetical protein
MRSTPGLGDPASLDSTTLLTFRTGETRIEE